MYVLLAGNEQLETIKKAWGEDDIFFNLITEDGNNNLMVKIDKPFGKGKPVRAVEDDRVFDSVKEAAYNYDVTPMAIIKSIQEQRKCRGKTFEYVAKKETLL